MAVSKQAIKNYLEIDSKDLSTKLEEAIDVKDEWKDFKSEFVALIAKYSENPTPQKKQEVDGLIIKYYSTKAYIAREVLQKILSNFGIREKTSSSLETTRSQTIPTNREDYRREIYDSIFGTQDSKVSSYDYIAGVPEMLRTKRSQSNDYKVSPSSPAPTPVKRAKEEREKEKEKETKPKSDGLVKKALKKLYYRATASMINAPGNVPPEILLENREKFALARQKVDTLIENLERAEEIVHRRNEPIREKAGIDDVLVEYDDFCEKRLDGNLTEKDIERLEHLIYDKKSKRFENVKSSINGLCDFTTLREELKEIGRIPNSGMLEKDLDEHIDNLFSKSRLYDSGKKRLELWLFSPFHRLIEGSQPGMIIQGREEIYNRLTQKFELEKLRKFDRYNGRDETIEFAEELEVARQGNDTSDSRGSEFLRILDENRDFISESFETDFQKIVKNKDEYKDIASIGEEVELVHKIALLYLIRSQFDKISTIVQGLDSKEVGSENHLTEQESQRRDNVLKIARRKVELLEKAGLSKVIGDGENGSRAVLRKSKQILLLELKDAKDVSKKDLRKLDEEQSKQ